MANRFPAVLKTFGHSSATLREASIADDAVVEQDFTPCFLDSFLYDRIGFSGDPLVTLAVIIGTDIEQHVIFSVVPTNQLLLILLATGIGFFTFGQLLVFLDLS